ncbi:hypothetical protein HPB51_016172 [Rhipicephalus microplus]|uniref:Uncharacterized protein n=1 Tax=Rhipicephalus microplus TaxID=6941 RepID=A0A9J6E2H2_RHIMP|nr:hypothetical protein HPB51_016172 [Rhipicephalus microplus]
MCSSSFTFLHSVVTLSSTLAFSPYTLLKTSLCLSRNLANHPSDALNDSTFIIAAYFSPCAMMRDASSSNEAVHLQQRLKSLSCELVTLRNRLHVTEAGAGGAPPPASSVLQDATKAARVTPGPGGLPAVAAISSSATRDPCMLPVGESNHSQGGPVLKDAKPQLYVPGDGAKLPPCKTSPIIPPAAGMHNQGGTKSCAEVRDLIHLTGPLTEDAVLRTLHARFFCREYFVFCKALAFLFRLMQQSGDEDGIGEELKTVMALSKLPEFAPGSGSFDVFAERFELYSTVNEIAEAKKLHLFLSAIGEEAYVTLRSLLLPKTPSTSSYPEVVPALKKHYSPRRTGVADACHLEITHHRQNRDIACACSAAEVKRPCGRIALAKTIRERFPNLITMRRPLAQS